MPIEKIKQGNLRDVLLGIFYFLPKGERVKRDYLQCFFNEMVDIGINDVNENLRLLCGEKYHPIHLKNKDGVYVLVCKDKARNHIEANFSEEEVKSYYTKSDFLPKSYKSRCISPWTTTYLFPDGSLGACEEIGISCGIRKEESFKKIWKGSAYKNFRRIIKKLKFFTVCIK